MVSDKLLESVEADTHTYINWLKNTELVVNHDLILAGSFHSHDYPVYPRYHDNFHYPLGMKRLLSLGFTGIRDLALGNSEKFEGNRKKYLLGISEVYNELTVLIERFAKAARKNGLSDVEKTCLSITKRAPESFLEACQLYWFATIFRIGTATIGRIDQHLIPYYKGDFEQNKRIINELLYRYEQRGNRKGDTLQNITLSGRDFEGNDQTNELSYYILEQCALNNYIEPKVNVRIHQNSPQKLLELVADFQFSGGGRCTVYNDDAIIDGLTSFGRPPEIAADYCADGCTEIILDGYGETAFRYVDCVKAIEHTLFNGEKRHGNLKKMQYYAENEDYVDLTVPVETGLATGSFSEFADFESFYNAYLEQLKNQVDIILSVPYISESYPLRLFLAATLPEVIDQCLEPHSSPHCYHSYGLFIGSLGTAVNSLAAVKFLVYDKNIVEPLELLQVLEDDFKGYEKIRHLCFSAPKFGNDDDYVDDLAIDIAEKFSNWVKGYSDKTGKPILPGLYNHLFHHTAHYVGATPDGRRRGDSVGEHFSPTPGTAVKGPTAIINSVCKTNTSQHIFGSTLHLNIPQMTFNGVKKPRSILNHINKVFCEKKGCVLNTNILNVDQLKDAQLNPEMYEDLIVRVWGFSYYFTKLSKEMQDHVISRA